MIRTTQTTSFQRVLTSLESDADALEYFALKLARFCDANSSVYRTDECQDALNGLYDIAADLMVKAMNMKNNAGQDALDTAAEMGSWE